MDGARSLEVKVGMLVLVGVMELLAAVEPVVVVLLP
jgi:hypothetical protein